jgi:hypothetical protein
MAIDSCLKCGKGPAQYGGLCANCRSNDISDTLEDSNKMPKFDIPQYIFFGPDLSAYVASLTKNRDNVSTPSARYNFDTKKYDITQVRNGVNFQNNSQNNFKNASTTKYSIGSLVYDLTAARNGLTATTKKDKDNKYTFIQYKIPVAGYVSDKKSSYGITPSNKYFVSSYTSAGGNYKGAKSTYSGASSKDSYSGSSSKGDSGSGSSK